MEYNKNQKILTVLLYLIFAIIGFYLVFVKFIPLLTPFIIAVIFAFLINPIVDFFATKLRFNRNLSAIFVLVLIFALLISLIIIAVSELYSLGEDIVSNMLVTANYEGLDIISAKINRIFGIEVDIVSGVKNLVTPLAQGLLSVLKSIATNIPQVFVSMIVFILSTYFMVVDKEKIFNIIYKLIGEKNVKWVSEIKSISKNSILKYAKAQFTIMLITFSELIVGLTIMELIGIINLKYIFILALGIALLDALPIFGTGAVLIPWSIYGVIVGKFDVAVAMLIMYIVCLVVRQFIEPKIVGLSLGLHPLVTLLSMFIGLKLIGIGGMILLPIITLFTIQLYRAGAFDKIKEIIK